MTYRKLKTLSFMALTLSCGAGTAWATENADIPTLPPAAQPAPAPAPDISKYAWITALFGAQGGLTYNDNIYRTSKNEKGDFIGWLAPRLRLKTNLPLHSFQFVLTPEIGRYFSETKNNYVDWNARATGRYDYSLTEALNVEAGYKHGHVPIGGFDTDTDATSNLSEPVTYDFYDGSARLKGIRGLWHYDAGAGVESYDYDDTRREDGTISVQDDRDRNVYKIDGRVGYAFFDPIVPYVRAGWNQRDYDKRIDSSLLFPRDSDGYEAAIGVARMIEGAPFGYDLSIGYLNQDYDSPALKDVDGLDATAQAFWYATPADKLEFSFDREVKESTSTGVSGALNTKADAGYTHTYSERISFGATASYTNIDYASNLALTSLDREDDIYEAGVNARYAFRPDADVVLEYNHRKRDSNQVAADYDSDAITATVSVKY